MDAILEVELTPYTQNKHYLETCKAKWLATYKDSRTSRRETPVVNTDEVLKLLAGAGYGALRLEDLGKLNPPDEYEEELRVMAEVRGYFQVSYKVRIALSKNLVTFSDLCSSARGL